MVAVVAENFNLQQGEDFERVFTYSSSFVKSLWYLEIRTGFGKSWISSGCLGASIMISRVFRDYRIFREKTQGVLNI